MKKVLCFFSLVGWFVLATRSETLVWNASERAVAYKVISVVTNTLTTLTNVDLGALPSGTFYFEVIAVGETGLTSPATTLTHVKCTYSLSSYSDSFSSAGGSGAILVFTTCGWYVQNVPNWITASIVGNEFKYVVAPNASGFARSATITVAGQSFVIRQERRKGKK